ncbi:ATPase, T2SS/T4P/T4SS family [archaeon]
MRLVVDECSHCNACVETCPHKANFECRQCLEPECVKACPHGAFYEAATGVWGIDEEKCDGCGLCAMTCPYNAIYVDGYARKCDLCGGDPKCAKVCVKGLRLDATEEENEETRRILGWEKMGGEYDTGVYFPSCQEARLVEGVVKAFREAAKQEDTDVEEVFEEYCEAQGLVLDEGQHEDLLRLMKYEVHGFSVLEPLLADESLEEITVNGIGEPIRVYRRGVGWLEADVAFLDAKKVVGVINRIARSLGRRITLQKPRINACLPNGSRLHAAIPPVTKQPCLTIRKFTEKPLSPRQLIDNETISAEAMAFLWMAMQCDLNILVAGSTGSGKTTTLNCLSAFIPLTERVIIVEETPEISIPHEHSVRLTVNHELGIKMGDLVRDTLRMRPDRIVVGEVRSAGEAKALMDTMLAGQGKGSVATFHALSTREAINRLKALGISDHDLPTIDLIVVQKRWDRYDPEEKRTEELRRVMEISEVTANGAKPLFDYDTAKGKLVRVGSGQVGKKIMKAFSLDELDGEWAKREKALTDSSEDFTEAVRQVNETVFGA